MRDNEVLKMKKKKTATPLKLKGPGRHLVETNKNSDQTWRRKLIANCGDA